MTFERQKQDNLVLTATYQNKERHEIIEISFREALLFFDNFYKQYKIDLPQNFTEIMTDIWERNQDLMRQEIEKFGYNMILLVPDTLITPREPNDVMGSKLLDGLVRKCPLNPPLEDRIRGNRIVLLHSSHNLTDSPELKKTLDVKYGGEKSNGVDNKGEDFIKGYEGLTLLEWIVLFRIVLDKEAVHIDDNLLPDGYYQSSWITETTSLGTGNNVNAIRARSCLDQGYDVDIEMYGPFHSFPNMGCRVAKHFFEVMK